ncbi:hypothetical protein DL122_11765 [Salmonella enterica subsp. salamae]|nr:hypothetical protein [Salmonella enterica subsp. salamae]
MEGVCAGIEIKCREGRLIYWRDTVGLRLVSSRCVQMLNSILPDYFLVSSYFSRFSGEKNILRNGLMDVINGIM